MIHATPAVAMAWMQGGGLTEQGGKLYTRVGGHIVVAGTGYGGNGPELAAQDPKVHWAYITTPIYLLRGPVESNYNRSNPAPNVQKQHNDGTAIVRRTVAAYSDGCLHAGIPVDTEGTVI